MIFNIVILRSVQSVSCYQMRYWKKGKLSFDGVAKSANEWSVSKIIGLLTQSINICILWSAEDKLKVTKIIHGYYYSLSLKSGHAVWRVTWPHLGVPANRVPGRNPGSWHRQVDRHAQVPVHIWWGKHW